MSTHTEHYHFLDLVRAIGILQVVFVIPPFYWGPPVELRGHFQFHSGCDAAYRHIGSVVIVSPEPFGRLVLSLLDGFKDVLVQPFVPYRAIVALDVGVLLRLARLDICDADATVLGPSHQ